MTQQIAMPWTKDEPRSVLLQLPWPTSVNAYWGTSRFGGIYVKAEGKAYKDAVTAHVRRLREPSLVGRIFFDAKFYPPDRRGRDLDNCFKVLIDAIADSGVIANDKHIKKINAEMMDGENVARVPGGCAIVELTEMPEPFTLF